MKITTSRIDYKHKDGITLSDFRRQDVFDFIDSRNESWMYTHSFPLFGLSCDEWFNKIDSSENDLVLQGYAEIENPRSSTQKVKAPIGVATFYNIDRHNRSLQIGGHIYSKHRSKELTVNAWHAGIDFAFEMLNMNRIYGEVLETNTAALKLNEAMMRKEGVKKEANYQSGRYLDSHMFGLTRTEWEESERVKGYKGVCNTQV